MRQAALRSLRRRRRNAGSDHKPDWRLAWVPQQLLFYQNFPSSFFFGHFNIKRRAKVAFWRLKELFYSGPSVELGAWSTNASLTSHQQSVPDSTDIKSGEWFALKITTGGLLLNRLSRSASLFQMFSSASVEHDRDRSIKNCCRQNTLPVYFLHAWLPVRAACLYCSRSVAAS